ncbi:hypothetical protein [Gracilibacillus alcaliphilus]|uniref:hypothetical protein n=1 Tax=Gracilibacillus alcaliphilus TaxID=1401441 RepID=UPI0019599F5C|nr:hypothetical protein [Gracilibacillus alcaliphilus]MBM7675997.1 flagellar protein FliT [Gracilibacillus alcaliphilus]
MRKHITAYIDTTKQILDLIDKAKREERDRLIERIEQLITKREESKNNIRPPFSESEIALGKQAVELDQQLEKALALVMKHIKHDMHNTKKQSKSNDSYLNPYKHVASFDGRFMDSKK